MGIANAAGCVLLVWTMALAVLFAAIAPTISASLAAGRTDSSIWLEICSSSGVRLVKVDTGNGDSDKKEHPALDSHCPFCRLQQHLFIPPAGDTVVPAFLVTYHAVLYAAVSVPLVESRWRPNRGRAPPPSC